MNIGVFYQSGHKFAACYMALKQLRTIYPDIPIVLIEDGSQILSDIAEKFNCNYTRIEQSGRNYKYYGRAVVDITSNIQFLNRVYNSLTTYLKNVDWIIFYEDDVWCQKKIEKIPLFDMNEAYRPLYTPELYSYLKNKFNIFDDSRDHWSLNGSLSSYGASGGSIWNREKFIEAYNKLHEIDWNKIYKLDTRPCEWADASLSFIFQHAGLTNGQWYDCDIYDSKKDITQQTHCAFIHPYKYYYTHTKESLERLNLL